MTRLVDGKTLITLDEEVFQRRLVKGLVESGYVVFQGLLKVETVSKIRAEIDALRAADRFRPASIGKGAAAIHMPETRGDGTYWFEPKDFSPIQAQLASFFESVRGVLNAELFLGLWDWEGHYAVYPPGTFYRKHLDRFQNDSKRTVSMVLFFNAEWKEEDGGALRIEGVENFVDILPMEGTVVFFLSEKIMHEVLETKRDRYSFAGWLRTRA
jgi:SM-20-related protein